MGQAAGRGGEGGRKAKQTPQCNNRSPAGGNKCVENALKQVGNGSPSNSRIASQQTAEEQAEDTGSGQK